MGQAGRRPKLTDELEQKFLSHLANHHYLKTACSLVGIGERTYHLWREKGEGKKDAEGNWILHPKPRYKLFIERVRETLAMSEVTLVENVVKKGGWKGSMEILKRRHHENWGDRHRMAVTGANDGPIKTEASAAIVPVINITLEGVPATTGESTTPADQWSETLAKKGITPEPGEPVEDGE